MYSDYSIQCRECSQGQYTLRYHHCTAKSNMPEKAGREREREREIQREREREIQRERKRG